MPSTETPLRLSDNQKLVFAALRKINKPATAFELALQIQFEDLNPFANKPESGEWDRHLGRVEKMLAAIKRKNLTFSRTSKFHLPIWYIRTVFENQESLFGDLE